MVCHINPKRKHIVSVTCDHALIILVQKILKQHLKTTFRFHVAVQTSLQLMNELELKSEVNVQQILNRTELKVKV